MEMLRMGFSVWLLLWFSSTVRISSLEVDFDDIDWEKALLFSSLSTESTVSLNCPCDSVPKTCESECCCDKDCVNNTDTECQTLRPLDEWLCEREANTETKLSMFCVVGGLSAYIGSAYHRQEFLSHTEVKKLVSEELTSNYLTVKSYEVGDPVYGYRWIAPVWESIYLLIPLSFNGNCATGVLAFNTSSTFECDLTITEENCVRLAAEVLDWKSSEQKYVMGDVRNGRPVVASYEYLCVNGCEGELLETANGSDLVTSNVDMFASSMPSVEVPEHEHELKEANHWTNFSSTYYNETTETCVNFPVNLTYRVETFGSSIKGIRIALTLASIPLHSRVSRHIVVNFEPSTSTESDLPESNISFPLRNESVCAVNKPICWDKSWAWRNLSAVEWLQVSQVTLLIVVLGIYYIKSAS